MSTLSILWREAENNCPEKTAVVDAGKHLTYRQLGESIRRIMAGFRMRWRLQPGEVVALLTPNCAEFVVTYFAATGGGASVQPVDERLTAEEIKAMLLDSKARYVIVHRNLQRKFENVYARIPGIKGVLGIDFTPQQGEAFKDWIDRPLPPAAMRNLGSGDFAELMYTSGTTGDPKGVIRSHGNVLAASRNSIRGFGYRRTDIIAIVMPLSHSSALNSQLIPLLQLGGTVVLVNNFDVRRLLSILQDEAVTCMRAVPTMLQLLLAFSDFTSEALPSLRLLINSSAPIDPQTYRALKERFPAIEVMNSYGLTEASTCTVLPDHLALSHAESVGAPIEGVEMCVRADDGRALGEMVEGEIYVRGDHVFCGYLNRPDATGDVLSTDGWLRTGDIGYRDSRGLYYLSGRKNDFINCGGHKFAAAEVESCIMQMPEVAAAAVIGVPHKHLGQVAKAFVVPAAENGLRDKQVLQYCARNLSSHKVPFSAVVVSDLPKTSTGKLLHRKLREV